MNPVGAEPPATSNDRETSLGRDGSGTLALVAPAAVGLAPQLLKRFDQPAGVGGRVRLAQRLWRLTRLALPVLPGLTIAQMRAGSAPACWVAAPELEAIGTAPALGPDAAAGLLAALLDTLGRAHQGRVTGLRFRPESLIWQADLGSCRWLAPDLAPSDQLAGGEALRLADIQALAAAFRPWLAEPPAPGHPVAIALEALAASGPYAGDRLASALAALGWPAPTIRLPAPASLLGREAELAELGDALQLAAADYRLVCVRLDGTEGAFQEELFDALAAEWGPAGVDVLAGRCRGADAVGAALRELMVQLRVRRGEALSPALHALAAPDSPPSTGALPALPPAAARARLFRAIDEELRRVRGHGPLVVALTAFDAADELTAAWVDHLVAQDAGMPCLLVLAGRNPVVDERAEAAIGAKPLDREETIQLARAYGGGPDIGVADALWEATQGERPRVYRWIQRRLAGTPALMPEGVRELLRAFATMGGAGDVATLHGLMEMADAAFFELLERALDCGWLFERGGRVEFVLPEDAAAIRAEMSPGDALRWHRRLAAVAALPPGERVRHALVGGPEGLAPVLATAAVRYLLAMGATAAAGDLAAAALAVAAPDDASRPLLLRALAFLALDRGEPAEAERLVASCEATDDAGPARDWLLGLARLAVSDYAGADAAFRRAVACAEDPADRGRLFAALAGLTGQMGDWAQARRHATQAVETRAEAADPLLRAVVDAEVRLVLARGLAAESGGEPERAEMALSEALQASEAVGHAAVAYEAASTLAELARSRERFGEAREAHQRARTWAIALGRTAAIVEADTALAAVLGEMGLFEAALGRLAGDDEPARAEGNRHTPEARAIGACWVRAQAVRALASLHLGYANDALRLLDQALDRASELGDEHLALTVHLALARALLFLGKLARAAGVAQSGRALAGKLGARAEADLFALLLAEAVWRLGERERAEVLVREVLAAATPASRPATRARALVAQARAEGFRGAFAAANGMLSEAWELAEATGLALVQAEIVFQRGELLRLTGDLTAAGEAYGLALARGDALGSPHHRALALGGLGAVTPDPASADAYRAQAVAHLTIYLEQLGESGRRDFLSWEERSRVLEPASGDVTVAETAPVIRTMVTGCMPARSTDAAADVLDLIAAGATPDDLIARLNETFRRHARAGRSMAYVVGENGEPRLRDRRADPEALTVLGPDAPCAGVIERVLATGGTVWVPDALAEPAWRDLPEVRDRGVRGVLCVPIKTTGGDGVERVLGCLYGDRPVPWQGLGEAEIAALERMARHAGVALRNAVLEEDSRRKTERLELIGDLTRALAGTLDVDRLLGLALRQVLAVTRGEHGYVFFGDDLACRASLDREGRALAEVVVSRSVIARVRADRLPLTILDIGQDEELQQKASLMIRNVRSVMCVPLVLDEHLIGLIYVSSSTANKTFGRHDLDVLTAIAAQVALMLQNAQAYETIKELNLGLEAKVQERTQALQAAMRELTETQAQLLETEKLATVGTLAAGVAHEINNPLGAVLTNAQLLKLDAEDPETIDSLTLIEEGARRCMEIVQALLKYSKPPQAAYQTLDVRAIVEDTLAMVERQHELDGIEVSAELADAPGVLGDAAELRQVVVQLLLNAADAIRERPGAGQVHVTLRRELVGLVLAVTDDGAGISPEVLRRIFDPFFTTKRVGSGQGLGLSVCRRVIEKHGGRIQVVSQPGAGAVVTVVLPVP